MLLYYKFIVENTEEGLKNFGYVILGVFLFCFLAEERNHSHNLSFIVLLFTQNVTVNAKNLILYLLSSIVALMQQKKTHTELSPLSMCLTTYSDMT